MFYFFKNMYRAGRTFGVPGRVILWGTTPPAGHGGVGRQLALSHCSRFHACVEGELRLLLVVPHHRPVGDVRKPMKNTQRKLA